MPSDSFLVSVSGLIGAYGYLAVFAGTLLEGETILLAAGFAAHQGLLDWWAVVAVAFVGGTLGDQLAFLLGRWKGNAIIARFPALSRRAPQVHRLLERYDLVLILIIRFLYGLRIAGPLIMGSSRIPPLRFSYLNMIGAVIWAVLVAGVGYAFGAATTSMFGHLKHIEETVLLVILTAGLAIWLWRHMRDKDR
ncbi:MAG: DedA family protein [Hydrogenophilales bacterium CG03_land_8_20_14_0_80_62_28]|nr:DedA family protein [Betaproteobacteria bacterium]OIO78661.1 MAG: DedA family protein [Hydrogenophilaceae bacterium CG1_02_62_390]PIV22430.1 MAG: DedA family protein [Hydrogenophilales bacterium CG03_land_8_20_14_0_80_62_28]PIW38092.1 MAG: DedA family protein [Hydrogenophilales bacterium CG15_BIG_FIL_POST_REV_8_21_14_020_62_31]PIW72833.1 MAG: DedA family protein [Hydrogenophilales bacterium CG12_big_fil_rev_8_21_14_0_65_61_21]PIX01143.1 MAG: DedA family protein [Hydrogenophilales bacterium 